MIRMSIAAASQDGAIATLREGEVQVGEALEAVTTLVLTSTFRTGRFRRLGMKLAQMSSSHIVIESGRHLTQPPLDEVSAFPAGCDRFSYNSPPVSKVPNPASGIYSWLHGPTRLPILICEVQSYPHISRIRPMTLDLHDCGGREAGVCQ